MIAWRSWVATPQRLGKWLLLLGITSPTWAQPLYGGARLPMFLLALWGLWGALRGRFAWNRIATCFKAAAALWALLALLIACSLWGAPRPEAGIGYAAIALGLAAATLVAGQAAAQHGDELVRGIELIARLTFYLLLGDALIQFIVGYDLLGVPYSAEVQEGRLVGPFRDSLKLPILLALLFPIAAWPLRSRAACLVLLWLATAWVVLLSGARSALLLLLLSSAPLLVRVLSGRAAVAAAAALLLLVAAAWMHSPAWQDRLQRSTEAVALLRSEPDKLFEALDHIATHRIELWQTALAMGAQHPIFGIGAKQFVHRYAEFARENAYFAAHNPYHAHHLWLALWAELGAAGVLWLIGAAGAGVWFWRRATSEARSRGAPFALSLAAYIFPLQSQPVLLSVWFLPLFWFFTTAYLTALSCSQKARESQQAAFGDESR